MSSWASIVSSSKQNVSTQHSVQQKPPVAKKVVSEKPKPVTYPSICIPWLPTSFSDGQVIDIINEIGLGDIEKVDLIGKVDRNDNDYLMAFIHMENWSMEGYGKSVRDDLLDDDTPPIKIVYDDPKFLMLSKSYTERPDGKGKTRKPFKSKRREKVAKTYVEDGDTWHVTQSKSKKTHSISAKATQQDNRLVKNSFASLIDDNN